MKNQNPMTMCDFYKLGHITMNPPGVKKVVSTWTPRHHVYTPNEPYTVHFGTAATIAQLHKVFNEFFSTPFRFWEDDFLDIVEGTFNEEYLNKILNSFADLHNLGYLPLEIYSLPEGTLVPDGVPVAMITNIEPEFAWLVQFLEDFWSLNSWLPSTSATTAYYRRKAAEPFFEAAGIPKKEARHLCGDFSMRGMTGIEASAMSGLGHLLSFTKTATINANRAAADYYDDSLTKPGLGLPSLEHSVIEMRVALYSEKIKRQEVPLQYMEYLSIAKTRGLSLRLQAEMLSLLDLLENVQPTGVFSYVADTYDYWGVVGQILPLIKNVIIERQGVLLIRPDSGDPVKILLGDKDSENLFAQQGTIRLLEDTFGTMIYGTAKQLELSIRVIYGDAITLERQTAILAGLQQMGFSPTTVNFGIGAYTYQYVTRDTRGYAMKAVSCNIEGYGDFAICKEPATDKGKKSQRGAPVVYKDAQGNLAYEDGFTVGQAIIDCRQLLKLVYWGGYPSQPDSIETIRNRLWGDCGF